MWYAEKAAFRVGGHIGPNSSFSTNEIGYYSFSSGFGAKAKGSWSFASGFNSQASGWGASALGVEVSAPSYGEVAVGNWNTTYTPTSPNSFNENDRAFVVGNGSGTGSSPYSDALTVMKNGEAKIGNNGTFFTNLQEGEFIAGSSTTVTKEVSIPFPSGFPSTTPVRVIVQPVGGQPTLTDEFIVTVKNARNNEVIVIIRRIDANSGWGQQLKLHWMAWQ
jgi:hypothetical protein